MADKIEQVAIISQEAKNEEKIYLYKENKFWSAYEMSAYLLIKNYWSDLKVISKLDSKNQQIYLKVGFIETSWEKIAHKLKATKKKFSQTEKQIIISSLEKDELGFKQWKKLHLSAHLQVKKQLQPFYGSLPVYKKTYDYMSLIISTVRKFPKDLQNILGKQLIVKMIEINLLFRELSGDLSSNEKMKHLERIKKNLEIIIFILRLAFDQKAYGLDRSVSLIEQNGAIVSQLELWQKKLEKNGS